MAIIKWYDVIDSTNSEAFRMMNDFPELTFFASVFQTNGRGQKGNSWESAKGENLTFSVLLKPEFLPVRYQFIVSQIISLTVKEWLSYRSIPVKIKWPNDIYAGDKKICGILIENHFSDVNLSASIAGIGINLNQTKFESDAPNPTSVRLESGIESDLKSSLEEFASFLTRRYLEVSRGDLSALSASLRAEYISSLYRLRENAFYEDLRTGERFRGQITGVMENGCVIIEKENGAEESFAFKELKYLNWK
jgi:BirA family biotin operon repressor/biotin-[acetyl-CoA-carboxylase] ligase